VALELPPGYLFSSTREDIDPMTGALGGLVTHDASGLEALRPRPCAGPLRARPSFRGGARPDKIHAALIERAPGGHIIGAELRATPPRPKRSEKPVRNKANDGLDPPAPDHPAEPVQAQTPTQGRTGRRLQRAVADRVARSKGRSEDRLTTGHGSQGHNNASTQTQSALVAFRFEAKT